MAGLRILLGVGFYFINARKKEARLENDLKS
jgi:hypothetical protein